jgi:hypothetical protein
MHLMTQAAIQQMYCTLRAAVRSGPDDHPDRGVDRGAVSLEQVLWFVAVGVSVVVVAAILWNKIIDQANTDVVPPTTPGGG